MIKIDNTIVTQEMFGDGTLKCPIPPIETALKIEQMHQASEHKRNMPATLE